MVYLHLWRSIWITAPATSAIRRMRPRRRGLIAIGQFAIINAVIVMSRLRELRKERGYTQIKMQMLTGIDQSAYSKIERGERYLSFEQCRRVALALDTSMDYLAGLTDEKKPYPRRK